MPELMKGKVWSERKHLVEYPVCVEDKHDEIRCHVIVSDDWSEVKFLSYSGKPLANMQDFASAFRTLTRGIGFYEFDVGVEVNGNFNDSYRWVRSTKGVPKDLVGARIRFLVFGIPSIHCTLDFQHSLRGEVVDYAHDWTSLDMALPYFAVCHNEDEVDSAFANARARGLEGVMVKQPRAKYERKRTDGWLKMKPENDADGIIVEIIQAYAGKDQPELGIKAGDPLGRAGSVRVRMEDGSEACPHGIEHALATEMWLNPQAYIGQWCEFNYMERDRQGGYRHPTFHRIREAK